MHTSLSYCISNIGLLLYFSSLGGVLLCCNASPVSRQSSRTLQQDEPIEKDWLTLGTGSSSSSGSQHYLQNPTGPQLPDVAQALQAPLANKVPPKPLPRLDETFKSRRHQVSRRLGINKTSQRKAWLQKFPGVSPPVHVLPHGTLRKMGLKPTMNRHHVVDYLEQEKMRREKVDWPLKDLAKPVVNIRFPPLVNKERGLRNRNLIKKQAEMDQLLDDDGLLTTSSAEKKMASKLFITGTRQRKPSYHRV